MTTNEHDDVNKVLAKRTIKASVFSDLFADKKYLVQLYKSLHPEDTDVKEDEFTYVTISNILTDGIYNDLGFMVGSRLVVLIEAQSTWTANIVVRALIYLVQTYQDYIKSSEQNLYGSKCVQIPKPELYVIFTGERVKIPEYMSLTDEFFGGQESAIEAKVKVIAHENEDDIIGQYIIFAKVYDEQMKLYGRTKKAITETIRICKDKGVLKEYLESREREVVNIMMTLFDQEEVFRVYVKEVVKEAVEAAVEAASFESSIRGAIEICERLKLSETDAIPEIASQFNLSQEKAREMVRKYWQ